MAKRHIIPLLLVLVVLCPAAEADDGQTLSAIASGLPLFQRGDEDQDDRFLEEDEIESWGAGGAKPLNFRLSFNFAGAYLITTHITDATHAEHWNEVWRHGVGGGLGFAVQLAPILRIGGGGGYLSFHGGKSTYGTQIVDYGDMHFFPLRGEGTLCFPLDLDVEAWFTPGLGFAPGIVPYIQVDVGLAYRTKVEAEQTTAGIPGPDLNLFKSDAGLFFGARLGIEFRTESVAFFMDVGYRLFTARADDDDIVGEILEMNTFPFQAGFALYFGA